MANNYWRDSLQLAWSKHRAPVKDFMEGVTGAINAAGHGATGDGTTDDTAAIQAAIDTIPATGGKLYLPAGTYKITKCLEVLDKSNVLIYGDGPGLTVLDASARTTLAVTDYLPGTSAVIVCDANNDATVLENIFVRHLEIKGSNSGEYKAVLFGTIDGFGCEHVKVNGIGYEAIDHIDYWSGATKRARNFSVRFCELENLNGPYAAAININSTGLVGADISHNYIHDCANGVIYGMGIGCRIADNLFVESGSWGCIYMLNESGTAFDQYHRGSIVSGNILIDALKNDSADTHGRRGIWAQSLRYDGSIYDAAVLVCDNVIIGGYGSASYAFYAIEADGQMIVKDNHIFGISDSYNNSIAILANPHNAAGTEQQVIIISGNVIEKSDAPYHIGIQLATTAYVNYYIQGNIVETGAIDTATNHFAFKDMNATHVVLIGNIFNDTISYRGASLNLADTSINTDDLKFTTFAAGDATPSVLGAKKFKTANSGSTTMTALDDGYVGQEVFICFYDNNTTVDFGSHLMGNQGVDYTAKVGDAMRCVCVDAEYWVCDLIKTAA